MKLIRRPARRPRPSAGQRIFRKFRIARLRGRAHDAPRPQRTDQAWFGEE